MPAIGWIDSPEFDGHVTPPGHPERVERLRAIRRRLQETGLMRRLLCAAPQPVERALLAEVHSAEYLARVEALSAAGGGAIDEETIVSEGSLRAAMLAAGAVSDAARRVVEGGWQRAFCAVRPPGHHATRARGMGFCLFNNVAVGAVAALRWPAIERVAILDWDAHHGNGTQDLFEADERVLYASWHQSPLYPGTGAASERGVGAGRGTVVNCPVRPGAGDDELLAAWSEEIEPALRAFQPDLLFISAGFDADERDRLTDLRVTPQGFAALTRSAVSLAQASCAGRLVSTLEGGYELEALADGVEAHLQALLEP